MSFRHQYVIGDVQGCFSAFQKLLKTIEFDKSKDKLWLAGDVVARGEDSLSTLRLAKSLHDAGCLDLVLGNHDITLIAAWRKIIKAKGKDNTKPIFQATDCDELLNWLRKQPLLHVINKNTILTHAGVPPHWSRKDAIRFAKEVECHLQADLKTLDKVLPHLYSKNADIWSKPLTGYDRLRAITNYFTRMRLCTKEGELEFNYKLGISKSEYQVMPKGYKPWFDWTGKCESKIIFGHWAALNAEVHNKHVTSTDAGCVWGGQLLAYRVNDGHFFSVDA